MAIATAGRIGVASHHDHIHPEPQSFIGKYIFSIDAKVIGIQYMVVGLLFFIVSGLLAEIVRAQLLTPNGAIVSNDTYNGVYSLHASGMIWMTIIPLVTGGFGNYVMPLMLGQRDVAFPWLNLVAFWMFPVAGVILFSSFLFGAPDAGWTEYPPISLQGPPGTSLWCVAIFLVGISSTLTGINFLVTIFKMRAPGMTFTRMPLFVWAQMATAMLNMIATTALAAALAALFLERQFDIPFYDPGRGGSPVLWQHMFWFYSHPAVYIMILPSLGVISEVISTFTSKKPFGYTFIAFSSVAIAVFGFLVWGHHLFVSSQSVYAGMVFSILSYIVAIPSAIKVFNWIATMYKGSIRMTTPMLYAMGFIGLFTIGGLTGLFLASLGMDVHLTDTYFVVAHFHYIMVGGAIMGYLAGLHFWWPKMTGRMYPEGWSKISAVIIFLGFNLTFFPQFLLGFMGMPRRYHVYPPEFQVLNVLSSAGASVLGLGYLIPFVYFIWSLYYGKKAPPNPWGATGLEWTVQSPPIHDNFEVTPVITQEAYQYTKQEEVHVG